MTTTTTIAGAGAPIANSVEQTSDAARSWRDVVKIHPAANKIPQASDSERRGLAGDLARHGLKVPVVLVRVAGGNPQLLDGRHRLDFLEGAGTKVVGDDGGVLVKHEIVDVADDAEAERLSLSLNAHRRHLTAKRRRELIAEALKATPEKSDRQIAETVKASPTTVGKVRAEMEPTVQPGQLKRVGKDGKARKEPGKRERAKALRLWQENERQWRAAWQAEGRSLADYEAGLSNQKSEVWDWRRAKGAASIAAENAAWLRDHPGKPLPKHLCSLSEAEGAEYDAWLKKYLAEPTAPVVNGNDVDTEVSAARRRQEAAADEVAETAPAAAPAETTSEVVADDEELDLLREFARFVINRANSVSVDPRDHAEWKSLRGRVKQAIGGGQS